MPQRERPQLRAAVADLRPGDTLVVWKLDRLARSIRQLIETVEDLQVRGIELRSLTESIDTATGGGRLIVHLFGALAEFKRAVIHERTSAGLQAARERGRTGGRSTSVNRTFRSIATLPPSPAEAGCTPTSNYSTCC